MVDYHKSTENTMKIFATQAEAKYYRRSNEICVPYGSIYGEQRWTNMSESDYITARYNVRTA